MRKTLVGRSALGALAWSDKQLKGVFPADKAKMFIPDGVLDLDVSNNGISELHADRLLARLPGLKKVNLANNLITSVTGLLPLAGLKHLESLDLRDNPCRPPGGRSALLALLLVPQLAENRRAAAAAAEAAAAKADPSGAPAGAVGSGAATPASKQGAGVSFTGLSRPCSAPQLSSAKSPTLRPGQFATISGRNEALTETVACARARLTFLRHLGARARDGAREEWRPQHVVDLHRKAGSSLPAAHLYEIAISDKVCGGGAAGGLGHFPELVVLDGEAITIQNLESAAEAAGTMLLEGPSVHAPETRRRPASGGCDVRRRRGECAKEYHNRFLGAVREFQRRLERTHREKGKVSGTLRMIDVDEDALEEPSDSDGSATGGDVPFPAAPAMEWLDSHATREDEEEFRAQETELWSQLREEDARILAKSHKFVPAGVEKPDSPRTRAAKEAFEQRLAATRTARVAAARLPEWLDSFARLPVDLDLKTTEKQNKALKVACDTASTAHLARAVTSALAGPRATPAPAAGGGGGGHADFAAAAAQRMKSQADLAKKMGLGKDNELEPGVLRRMRARGMVDRRSDSAVVASFASSGGITLQQWLRQLAQDYPEEFVATGVDGHPEVLESPLWVLDLHENPKCARGWHLRLVRLTMGGHLWVGPKGGEEGEVKLHLGGQSVMNLQIVRCRRGIETLSSLNGFQVFPFRIDLIGARVKRLKYFAATSSEACDEWMRVFRNLSHLQLQYEEQQRVS